MSTKLKAVLSVLIFLLMYVITQIYSTLTTVAKRPVVLDQLSNSDNNWVIWEAVKFNAGLTAAFVGIYIIVLVVIWTRK